MLWFEPSTSCFTLLFSHLHKTRRLPRRKTFFLSPWWKQNRKTVYVAIFYSNLLHASSLPRKLSSVCAFQCVCESSEDVESGNWRNFYEPADAKQMKTSLNSNLYSRGKIGRRKKAKVRFTTNQIRRRWKLRWLRTIKSVIHVWMCFLLLMEWFEAHSRIPSDSICSRARRKSRESVESTSNARRITFASFINSAD